MVRSPFKETVIFVYNADSGFFSVFADAVHKIVSPETYQCNLCRLTYGNLTEKVEWKRFIRSLTVQATFMHRDDFLQAYPDLAGIQLPALFRAASPQPVLVASSTELGSPRNLVELEALVQEKISSLTDTQN